MTVNQKLVSALLLRIAIYVPVYFLITKGTTNDWQGIATCFLAGWGTGELTTILIRALGLTNLEKK